MRPASFGWLKRPLTAMTLLVIAMSCLQHAHVPLYDGVSLPDEAYRYVQAPFGKGTSHKASGATASGLASDGFNKDGIFLNTDEQGPQIYVSFTQHSLAVSDNTTTIDASLQPLAQGSAVTSAGKIAGNPYRLTASANDGSPVRYAANPVSPSYVDMRLPQGYPVGAVMVYRQSSTAAWQVIKTQRVGNDIYESKVVGLGDYGLTSHAAAPTSSLKKLLVIVPIAVLASVLLIVIVIIRRSPEKSPKNGPAD